MKMRTLLEQTNSADVVTHNYEVEHGSRLEQRVQEEAEKLQNTERRYYDLSLFEEVKPYGGRRPGGKPLIVVTDDCMRINVPALLLSPCYRDSEAPRFKAVVRISRNGKVIAVVPCSDDDAEGYVFRSGKSSGSNKKYSRTLMCNMKQVMRKLTEKLGARKRFCFEAEWSKHLMLEGGKVVDGWIGKLIEDDEGEG